MTVLFQLWSYRSRVRLRRLFDRDHEHLHYGKQASSRLEADRKTHSLCQGRQVGSPAGWLIHCGTKPVFQAALGCSLTVLHSKFHLSSSQKGVICQHQMPFHLREKPDASPHALVSSKQEAWFFFIIIILSFHKTWGCVSGPSVIEVLGLHAYLPTSWARPTHWTWLLYLPVKNVLLFFF